MQFMANRCEVRLQFVRLTADAAQGLTNLPGQNDRCDDGAYKLEPRDYGRRLIYGGVNFVIGSLGEVSRRDRRGAYHGGHEEKNERPDSTPHRAPPWM